MPASAFIITDFASFGKKQLRRGRTVTLFGCSETAVCGLAQWIAQRLHRGDMIGLRGDVGVGKTTFARHLIRHWQQLMTKQAQNHANEMVPSPTYTWVQTYEAGSCSLAHIDLYRLERADDLDELGIDELCGVGCCVIEWIDKAETLAVGRQYLDISMTEDDKDLSRRDIVLTWSSDDWQRRLCG